MAKPQVIRQQSRNRVQRVERIQGDRDLMPRGKVVRDDRKNFGVRLREQNLCRGAYSMSIARARKFLVYMNVNIFRQLI